eukprot:10718555-Alexandrium_andersonii.AAC.2
MQREGHHRQCALAQKQWRNLRPAPTPNCELPSAVAWLSVRSWRARAAKPVFSDCVRRVHLCSSNPAKVIAIAGGVAKR